MDKNKYLSMTSDELYQYLISDIMSHLEETPRLIDELTMTERYHTDDEFQIFVDTAKAIYLTIHRQNTQLIPLCTDLISQATDLELWRLVVLNLNLLGNSYFMINAFERALSYYQAIIKIEAKHNFLAMTSIAYHNIALIYMKLEAHDITQEYFELSLQALERGGPDQPRYKENMIKSLSNLIPSLCQVNRLDEVPPLLDRISSIGISNDIPAALYSYHAANMYYNFYSGKYVDAKKSYLAAKDNIPGNDKNLQTELLYVFVSLCDSFQMDYDFYLDDLLSIESLDGTGRASMNVQIYGGLQKYYQQIGDHSKREQITKKYIQLLEQNVDDIRTKQLNSLLVVSDLLCDRQDLANVASLNMELKLAAEETNRHKNALQEAYYQIEMINELGQKMTSSLKLTEVIDLIYRNIKENIPLTSFALVVAEPEQQKLRSVVYYEEGQQQPEFYIPFDDQNSIFLECYQKNKLILSDNIYTDQRFADRTLANVGKNIAHSVVYMPLAVGEQIIGVCSIQNKKPHVYTAKHTLFLKQLLPYLSISLNNAVRSWKLEHEIRSHLKTQVELEKANHRLELLSALDSLTQISSRRDFESRFLDLIHEAKTKKMPVSVFMFDIDNFKNYNDTYGHFDGDEVLKKVAQVIRNNLDAVQGLSARFGGEEFIGACLGLNLIQSRKLANQIRQDVYDLNIKNLGSPLNQVSVSIGVAVAKEVKISQKSELLRLADTSLYQAKNSGKNKVIAKKIES